MTLYGHILDSQSRSIMAINEITGQRCHINPFDPTKGENKTDKFLQINPCGQIPMIEEGNYKVMGGSYVMFVYMCKRRSEI